MKIRRADERAVALAAVVQACYLVNGVARTGMVGEDSMAGCLESIFVTNPVETMDVYKSGNGVRTGLRLVTEILGDFRISEHGDTLRYTLAILALEKRLQKAPDVMRAIGAGISRVHEHFCLHEAPVTGDDIVSRLSDLYEETAGSLEPRVRVVGQQKHLKNSANTSRIRALLLAALRSAVLWRQLDGRLTQLILGRRRFLYAVNNVAEIVN
jgi:high frequency lysogenization protein